MFSGIVQSCGKIVKITSNNEMQQLWVQSDFTGLELGESIALDGCCVTVAAIESNLFACDISPETYQKTIIKFYQVDQLINLERSLRFMDRCSGHWVLGHIDETIAIKKITPFDDCYEITFSDATTFNRGYLIQKGSVALNGISLTINTISADEFTVMIIPHTWMMTNLKNLSVNSRVNIEYDYLAKIVVNQTNEILKGANHAAHV